MEEQVDLITILEQGTLSLKGEFVWGSNYTFLVEVQQGERVIPGVYKPSRGERPLWDFPTASLAKREAAAFVVSEALGWGLVPPTVYRRKGPYGAGSLQLYIDHDPQYHYFNFTDEDVQRLRPVVVFDLLINNADRKGSHILKDPTGRLWLIDHGVCFHVEDKLRTVIWDFVGEPIPQELLQAVQRLAAQLQADPQAPSELAQRLHAYLSWAEVRALQRRALRIVETGVFPEPDPHRRPFPWPQI